MNTCDKCQHFNQSSFRKNFGDCALMGDSNDLEFDFNTGEYDGDRTKAYGWDCEGYGAGVYVGPKFGCIHWVAKDA